QQALAAVNATACQQSIPLPDGTVAVPDPPPPTPRREQERADQRAAARQATYETVRTLRHQGWTVPAIAAQVGCSRRTVERYLCLPTWPVRQHRRHYGHSILTPYKDYLLERWNAGCPIPIHLFLHLQSPAHTVTYRLL